MAKPVGAGGTPGGIGIFLGGVVVAGIALFLLFSRVVVHSGAMFGWLGVEMGQDGGIVVVLLPFIVGIAILFNNATSRVGWTLMALSLLVLLLAVVSSLRIHFMPTSLPTLLGMFATLAVGLGMMFRSFKASGDGSEDG